jgi:S1-C subfamily serine protease
MTSSGPTSIPRASAPLALLLALLLLTVGACAADDPADPANGIFTTTSDRPPLDDPPDPGPVPADDGFTRSERDAIVAGTVRVTGFACGVEIEGSGFAVAPELIVTNAHVLVGVEEPLVETVSGSDLTAVPVAFDPVDDLAVLRVAGADLRPFDLGDAADGTVGTLVGWEDEGEPAPRPFRIDRPVTVRIDAVIGDERVERRSWLVAADIDSGDSGAALVDHSGTVVGIAYATTRRDAGVAYATRASRLEDLLESADLTTEITLPECHA